MNVQTLTKPFVVAGTAEDLFSKVLRTVVTIPQSLDRRWLMGNISAIDREITTLKRFMRKENHFPIENVKETAPDVIARLMGTRKHFQMALAGYPQLLDPSFLAWRKDNLPVFITMNWTFRGDFKLTVVPGNGSSTRGDDYAIEPELNPVLAMQYYPAAKHLFGVAREEGLASVSISAHFAGSIPGNTRVKMDEALETGLFEADECLISAEAPKWQIQKTVRVEVEKYPDPIVFGGVRVGDGLPLQYYVIDVFNLTAVELAALEQFALNPHR